MYILTRVFMFYFTLGSAWVIHRFGIPLSWRFESLEIICLSCPIYFNSVVLLSLYLVILLRLLLSSISFVISYVTLIYLYSSFMNYYFFYFRCIILLCVCDLWLYLFTVYSEICQILFTMRYFEQFNSGMSVYLYTYNGCEWSKNGGSLHDA